MYIESGVYQFTNPISKDYNDVNMHDELKTTE